MASLNPISGVLGKKRAAHLLRRMTFGPTIAEINQFATLTIEQAFQLLFDEEEIPGLPIEPTTGQDWIHPNSPISSVPSNYYSQYTMSWWMENMRASGMNVTSRMVWFYYTHTPIIISRVESYPQFAIDYLRLLRHFAIGNYKELMKKLTIDNAMLLHLDLNANVVGVPQENFSREFLELFTVGKGLTISEGNYTTFSEQDVKAGAKVLTGWGIDKYFLTIDPDTQLPTGKVKSNNQTQASFHDTSDKHFTEAFNNTVISTNDTIGSLATIEAVYDEKDEYIDMVFSSSYTAQTIVRRMYRQFVYFNITEEIENDIIIPLSNALIANEYDLPEVLKTLLKSQHFYDEDNTITHDDNIGAIIKSPMDLIIGTLRLFELNVPSKETDLINHYNLYDKLIDELSLHGLELLEPYDVAGHDPYFQPPDFHRYWISSNYLANRYKFIEKLINGIQVEGQSLVKLDIVTFVKNKCSNPSNATTLVNELVEWLLPIELSQDRFDYFKDVILLDQLSEMNWATEWNNYLNNNIDTNVRIQLERLAIALMQSPEYQLF